VQTEITLACGHCGKMVKRNACRANKRTTYFECRIVIQKASVERRLLRKGIPAKEPFFPQNETRR
jgi:hypothetical protein